MESLDGNERKLRHAIKAEEERFLEREQQLVLTTPDASGGGDKKLPGNQQNRPVAANAHFSDKVYYFPESFNALRRELENNWKEVFETPLPGLGVSPAWCMVHNALQFIAFMNGFTGESQQMDTENVDGICKTFLNALRKKRDVSIITFG